MKKIHIVLFFLPVLYSCNQEPKLESDSSLFMEYRDVENEMNELGPAASYEGKSLSERYGDFLLKYGWDGDLSEIPDGVYEAYSQPKGPVYLHYVRFKIEDHQFTEVYYNEFNEGETFGKRTDQEYLGKLQRRGIDGVNPGKDYPELERQLLHAQNPLNIDGVSGATESTYWFQLVVLKALYEIENKVILNDRIYKGGELLK